MLMFKHPPQAVKETYNKQMLCHLFKESFSITPVPHFKQAPQAHPAPYLATSWPRELHLWPVSSTCSSFETPPSDITKDSGGVDQRREKKQQVIPKGSSNHGHCLHVYLGNKVLSINSHALKQNQNECLQGVLVHELAARAIHSKFPKFFLNQVVKQPRVFTMSRTSTSSPRDGLIFF